MPEAVKGKRTYRSALREERALANRVAILTAALRRFLEDGYAATSIARIAEEAGVSEDLVYKLFTNKRGLLVEVLNFAVTGQADSPRVLDQEGPRKAKAEPDQQKKLAMFSAEISDRIARARPVDDVMRSAGEVDPEMAAKYASMHRTRLRNITQFVTWLAEAGPLRNGLTVEQAAETTWLLCSPATHKQLTEQLGWDQPQYSAWLHATLTALLIPPSAD
ncbi:MAG TPA: helix-turn-helix domain-containing protein [Nocardioides sp.]|uniref:TetR/AcrR family transcriptional regulator n=1 Tax=Nocardioides sp. TaxID=35761 RepID=UPI002F3F2E60